MIRFEVMTEEQIAADKRCGRSSPTGKILCEFYPGHAEDFCYGRDSLGRWRSWPHRRPPIVDSRTEGKE